MNFYDSPGTKEINNCKQGEGILLNKHQEEVKI